MAVPATAAAAAVSTVAEVPGFVAAVASASLCGTTPVGILGMNRLAPLGFGRGPAPGVAAPQEGQALTRVPKGVCAL